jgi:hypothetical protein
MGVCVNKIVSGGQTGVDRAGLDAAMEAGIPIGGYCPKGRLAEDGTVPERYQLMELTKGGYSARTEKNVVESDGTLILNIGKLTGGSMLTAKYAKKHNRPYMVVQLDASLQPESVVQWIMNNDILVLNVAGPRESKFPEGVYLQSVSFLRSVFASNSECASKGVST